MNGHENSASPGKAGGPARAVRPRRPLRAVFLLSGSLAGLVLGLFAALQLGTFDALFAGRARAALAAIAGPEIVVGVDHASVRFGRDGRLAIEADAVSVERAARPGQEADVIGKAITSVDTVRLVLDPVPILSGEFKVVSVEIGGVTLDARLIGGAPSTDWDLVRVDAIEPLTEAAFTALDRAFRLLERSRTQSIRLTGAELAGTGADEPPRIEEIEIGLSEEGAFELAGLLTVAGQEIGIAGNAVEHRELKTLEALHLSLTGIGTLGNPAFFDIPVDAPVEEARRRFGLESEATIELSALRAAAEGRPSVTARIAMAPGEITLGGIAAPFGESVVSLGYFPAAGKVEILPSRLNVARSSIPFSGGIIDLSRLEDVPGRGFAVEAVIDNARIAPTDTGLDALPVNGKVFARYLKHHRRLVFDEIAVDSAPGGFAASSAIQFGKSSPAISFAGRFQRMETEGIKQLWPYWLGARARQWMIDNVVGGVATDGRLRVYIPAGRMAEQPGRLDLDEDQLAVSMTLRGSRVHVAGDIPPLRDTVGHVDFRGRRLDVAVEKATAYFPSGRTVAVRGGTFNIADTKAKPLMAEIDMAIGGKADAMAELVSYRPIAVLDRIGYAAEDFTGLVEADVKARFGLLREQEPPPPDFDVAMELTDVAVAEPVEGRMLSEVSGSLAVDPDKAVLDATAAIDGAPLEIALTRPIGPDSTAEPARRIAGTLDDAARSKLLPGLDGLISGPIGIELTQTAPGEDSADIDLSVATLSPPALGWEKPAGVPAHATFNVRTSSEGTEITDFVLSGDGILAEGEAMLSGGGLSSASFHNVRLSPGDDFDVAVERGGGGGLAVDIRGRSIDLRPMIGRFKRGGSGGPAGGGAAGHITLAADIEQALGHDGEVLSGLSLRYEGTGSRPRSVDLRAVTGSGEAAVLTFEDAEGVATANLTAGDAGALARFADLYRRVSAGRLEVALSRSGEGPFTGTLRIADFSVINENQLRELVTARAAGAPGSLSDAIEGTVDTAAMRFERGYAQLTVGAGTVAVTNGVLRGQEIGLSFQGTVVDPSGNMAITGTFMPAYGLNRLFAEIPLFGALLGNGRDRGLIGITFRLDGKAANPQLTVNPISVIAPGVFRQIFEF